MKTILHFSLSLLITMTGGDSYAQKIGSWNGIGIYEHGNDTIEFPFDGKNITGHIQLVNEASVNSPSGIMCQVKCAAANGGKLNVFPNGGKVAVLQPGDSSSVNNWFLELIQSPVVAFTTGEYRTIEVEYAFSIGADTYSAKRNYVLYYAGADPTSVSGNTVLSGKIVFPSVSDIKTTTLTLGTQNWKGISLPLTLSETDTGYVFSTTIPDRNTWYLSVGGALTPQTVKIDRANTTNIRIEVETAVPSFTPTYELVGTATTSTGFWRGSASNSEKTICVFPGQENWKAGDEATLKAEAKIYKYNFDGSKVWEYAPGWEAWGGDMSKDGKYVAYALYTGTGSEASNSKYKL